MVKDGYKFAAGPLLVGVVLLAIHWNWLGGIAIVLGLFVLFFFRDPERTPPSEPSMIVSPADGRIRAIEYRTGKFYAAMRGRASAENEQNSFYVQSDHGEIVFKQIAGWVA